ncbi:MAG: (2Fe-2S)-binding protein [Dokdonella sp.]
MPRELHLRINGKAATAIPGERLVATLLNAGIEHLRLSSDGSPRGSVCGMGICMECRVRVNGEIALACLTVSAEGMEVSTDA